MRSLAVLLIIAAAAWRILAVHAPEFSNFSPVMALAFCGGAYFRSRWMWLVPFAALACSDLYLDHYYAAVYGYHWGWSGPVLRMLCVIAGLQIGRQIASRRSWAKLLGGSLAASALFYLVTNTASFLGDFGYAQNVAGWWQAMTIGHPQYPSTLYFFRNTLASDLLFTGLFVLAMEYAALRSGAASLFAKRAS